jgi:hypothetical protein
MPVNLEDNAFAVSYIIKENDYTKCDTTLDMVNSNYPLLDLFLQPRYSVVGGIFYV